MSFARKLQRRLDREKQKNPLKMLPPLQEMQNALADLQAMRDAIEETREVMNQTFPLLIGDINTLYQIATTSVPYQIERMKAVNLRLLRTTSEGPKLLVSGVPGASPKFSIQQLLDFQRQYEAEYDAMYAFVVLAENLASRTNESEPSQEQ